MKLICRLALGFGVLCAVAAPKLAFARTYCTGNVRDLYVSDIGAVIVKGNWRGTWTQMCNLNENWKGILPPTCMAWFTLLQAAQRETRPIKVQYAGDLDCSALPTYSNAPPPGYVMLD